MLLKKIGFSVLFFVVGSVLTVVATEALCGVALKFGARSPEPVQWKSSQEIRELLPFELPQSLGMHPQYKVRPIPRDEGEPTEKIDYFNPTVPLTLARNIVTRHRRYFAGSKKTIYDIPVDIDEFGRRRAYPENSKRNSQYHLLMVGCSYIFGDGVPNEGTIPWHLNLIQNNFEAYNSGLSGRGTSDFLARFLTGDVLEGIPQKRGILVYNFYTEHLYRSIGHTSVLHGRFLSVIERVANRFIFRGPFYEVYPLQTTFGVWFAKTNLAKFFGLYLPIVTDSHYEFLADMILEMKNRYLLSTHPDNQFVVTIYPQGYSDIDLDYFRKSLVRRKIQFIDYSAFEISSFVNGISRIPYDDHPNSAAHRIYSEVLWNDLQPLVGKISVK